MTTAAAITLGLAALLCALVAGLVFTFALVVMPGIRRLGDREFIASFQQIDGVIQRGSPLFGVVWMGSALALLAGLALGFGQVGLAERLMLVVAAVIYILGVHLPTLLVNIPLNNALQEVDLASTDEDALRDARARFEARWNLWNQRRTLVAIVTSALVIAVLARV